MPSYDKFVCKINLNYDSKHITFDFTDSFNLNILVVAFFTLTPLSCLTAFVWHIVDIARYSKKPTESKELLRAWGQLAVWAVFVVYLLFVCGPIIVGIGC